MLETDTSINRAPVTERSYKAFISYRHKPLDREAAEMIQKHLERYRVPKEFRDTIGGDRLGIVFRDEDELPASSSLSDSITYALDHSEYLIVICTPDLPDSRWCEQEIRYFTEKNGPDKIIAVLADGEPYESFSPYMLHEYDEKGDIISDREPLAANIKGPNHTIDKKIFKKEIVRLYAALIGCPFDSLWQREKRRQNSRLIGILSSVMLLLSLFLGIVISNNIRISEKNQEIQKQMSTMYIDAGFESLQEFDIKGAANKALLSYAEGTKDIYDHRIEALLSQVLNVYKKDNIRPEILYKQSVGISDILPVDNKEVVYISDEAGYVRCIDVNTGKFVGTKNLEQTAYEANKEAAKEIAKTLRRRNLSGIIVIDFIDMQDEKHQKQIVEYLKEQLKKDNVKTSSVEMTTLGLVELTRKKSRLPVDSFLLDNPGERQFSIEYLVFKLRDKMIAYAMRNSAYNYMAVKVNQELMDAILETGYISKDYSGILKDKKIYFGVDNTISRGESDIKFYLSEKDVPSVLKELK